MHREAVAMIPEDLTGKSVLDIGGYDGAYAKLCLERGAREATVLDSEQWRDYGWAVFRPASGVQYVKCDLLDPFMSRNLFKADLVLCFNMLYHVKNVWGACEVLRELTKDTCLIYTQILYGTDEPVWRNWQKHDANYNDKCYWKPSESGLCSLLYEVGFKQIDIAGYGVDERIALVCGVGI